MITLRMDTEMEAQLKSIAARANRKQSDIMRCAIAQYMEEMEDYLDAVDALEELQNGGDTTVSLDELLTNVQS